MSSFLSSARFPRARGLCSSAVLLLAFAGCSDLPVAPEKPADAPAATADALTASESRGRGHRHGRLTSNRHKYRDRSGHATGRSGSATLQAAALLAPGGVTHLTVTTGDLDDLENAPGELQQVQVKAFGPDGDHLFTRNFHKLGEGSVSLDFPGLPPGTRLCVKANIKGIDRRRTDVVSLCATVRLAPDVEAQVTAPDQAFVGAPTIITTTVSEVDGQAGTRADCQLWVDGALVDHADGIWVDAGDAVSCAFTHAFTTPGAHDVEVRVVTHGDLGVPSETVVSSDVVDVVSPNRTTFTATAEEKTVETSALMEYTWEMPNGTRKAYREEVTHGQRSQSIVVNGLLTRAAAFPLALVDLEVESSGVVYHDETWVGLVGVPDGGGGLCLSQTVTPQGAMFHLCSRGGETTFGYTRFAGTVTYHSQGFSRIWDGPTGALTQNFEWNDFSEHSPTGGQIRGWGQDVRVRIQVTDLGGTFSVAPVIGLTPFSSTDTSPRSCELIHHYWLEGNAQETCTWTETRESGRRGSASSD